MGKRLAFDAAKGRLWVVCTKCERWNLSPLDERWEAIEEAERAYRDTKKRVATENVGLARLNDGTDLIRIGAPLRPEFAAWRYGDQFGRRRRKQWLYGAGAVAAYGGLMIGGPALGLAAGTGVGAISNVFNFGNFFYQKFVPRVRVADSGGALLPVTAFDLRKAQFSVHGRQNLVRVTFPYRALVRSGPLLSRLGILERPGYHSAREAELEGDVAIRAMAQMLPSLNGNGGSGRQVERAVAAVEEHRESLQSLVVAAVTSAPKLDLAMGSRAGMAAKIPLALRLALEMAVHEDDERRALEGELHVLEQRWKDAEEIANIADGLTLPEGLDENVEALRRKVRPVHDEQIPDSES